MDVTGVNAVKLDPGVLQMKHEMNPAPAQAVLATATKAPEPSDSSNQAGYQRQQPHQPPQDTVELRRRNEEWIKPKIIPSPPDFEVKLAGAPEVQEFPAMPNSHAIEVIRRYDEMSRHVGELEKGLEDPLDVAA